MTAQKWTRGPWLLRKETTRGEFVTAYKIRAEDDSLIATLGPVAQDANARLIAAAPEMYEALTTAYDLLDNSDVRHYISSNLGEQAQLHRALNAARAILAKAVGE